MIKSNLLLFQIYYCNGEKFLWKTRTNWWKTYWNAPIDGPRENSPGLKKKRIIQSEPVTNTHPKSQLTSAWTKHSLLVQTLRRTYPAGVPIYSAVAAVHIVINKYVLKSIVTYVIIRRTKILVQKSLVKSRLNPEDEMSSTAFFFLHQVKYTYFKMDDLPCRCTRCWSATVTVYTYYR